MIGERIKKLREINRMSLSDLSSESGIAKSYLSSLERNLQSNPSIKKLEKLAEVFRVPVNEILLEQRIENGLDSDWIKLVQEAINSGVSKSDFREFVSYTRWKMES